MNASAAAPVLRPEAFWIRWPALSRRSLAMDFTTVADWPRPAGALLGLAVSSAGPAIERVRTDGLPTLPGDWPEPGEARLRPLAEPRMLAAWATVEALFFQDLDKSRLPGCPWRPRAITVKSLDRGACAIEFGPLPGKPLPVVFADGDLRRTTLCADLYHGSLDPSGLRRLAAQDGPRALGGYPLLGVYDRPELLDSLADTLDAYAAVLRPALGGLRAALLRAAP